MLRLLYNSLRPQFVVIKCLTHRHSCDNYSAERPILGVSSLFLTDVRNLPIFTYRYIMVLIVVLRAMKNKKIYIILSLAVLAMVLATSFTLHALSGHNTPDTTKRSSSQTKDGYISTDPATEEQKQAGDTTKQNTIDNSGDTASSNTVNMTITAMNQANGFLYIRILIETVTSAGSCTLSMSGPDGKTYSDTASVQPAASSTTCMGFNVPLSKLSAGDWNTTVTFTGSNTTATVSKGVTIR